MGRILSVALAGTLALTVLVVSPVPSAWADTERTKTGSCSGSATWKLEVDKESGRIEADFFVNSTSGAGVGWHVQMWDNGTRFFNQTRYTNRYGNFEAEGNTNDRSGVSDTIKAKASNNSTGQVCQGSLSI